MRIDHARPLQAIARAAGRAGPETTP